MKQLTLIGLVISLLITGCAKEDDIDDKNEAPSCNILTPTDNQLIESGMYTISCSFDDPEGNVASATLMLDGLVLHEFSSGLELHYTWDLADVESGWHTLKFIVSDNGGKSCISEIEVIVEKSVRFSIDIQAIFDLKCVACHVNLNPILLNTVSYDNLMNGGYINVDNPEQSVLYQKVISGHPGGSSYLSAEEIALLLKWIVYGALDN
jgi:hypothetical protein